MLYVGLDAHWRQSTFCVLDGHGRKILSRTVQGRWPEVLEEVGKRMDCRTPVRRCGEVRPSK